MNILDKRFKYVTAAKTDVSKTFARERARLKAKEQREAAIAAEQAEKVEHFDQRRKASK